MSKSTIYIKTKEVIACMRKAGLILQKAQKAMKDMIKPGVTLNEIDRVAEKSIRSEGGIPGFLGYQGFPKTICTMLNSEVVHGIPDERKLKAGDLISVDCGVLWKDLNADAAFTVIVGGDDTNPARARFSKYVKRALEAGCAVAKAGNTTGDIGWAVENEVRKGGYSVVRDFTGHGLGYDLHEDPYVFNYGKKGKGEKLVEGMTIAIEPIIAMGKTKHRTLKDGWTVVTCDGKDACQWEHFGVIRKDGFEILS